VTSTRGSKRGGGRARRGGGRAGVLWGGAPPTRGAKGPPPPPPAPLPCRTTCARGWAEAGLDAGRPGLDVDLVAAPACSTG